MSENTRSRSKSKERKDGKVQFKDMSTTELQACVFAAGGTLTVVNGIDSPAEGRKWLKENKVATPHQSQLVIYESNCEEARAAKTEGKEAKRAGVLKHNAGAVGDSREDR